MNDYEQFKDSELRSDEETDQIIVEWCPPEPEPEPVPQQSENSESESKESFPTPKLKRHAGRPSTGRSPVEMHAPILARIPAEWRREKNIKTEIADALKLSVYSVSQRMRLLYRYGMIEKRPQPELREKPRKIPLWQIRRVDDKATIKRLRQLRIAELAEQKKRREPNRVDSITVLLTDLLEYLDPPSRLRQLPEENIEGGDEREQWELVQRLLIALGQPSQLDQS